MATAMRFNGVSGMRANDFGGRIPSGCVFVKIGNRVGFYELTVIDFGTDHLRWESLDGIADCPLGVG
jgi:hypothetical protein